MVTTETSHEDREETTQQRSARIDTELAALSSPAPDGLRARIMGLLACGRYLDQGREGECVRDALIRYAASVSKAVAVASAGAEHLSCNTGAEVTFTDDDVTDALLGLSAFLEMGPALLSNVEHADERRQRKAASEVAS